jgi:hypothetical protein
MHPSERTGDPQEALRQAFLGFKVQMWTACPGIVESFTDSPPRVSVRLATQAQVELPAGEPQLLDIAILEDVPVVFQGGGGYRLTFPIRKGDECLVVFSSRAIDGWWQTGEPVRGPEARYNDLSDGFALIGPLSKPRALSPGVAMKGPQLRSDDGATFVEVSPSLVTLKATNVRIEADQTTITGKLRVMGETVFEALARGVRGVFGNVSVHEHRHQETQSVTMPPNPEA